MIAKHIILSSINRSFTRRALTLIYMLGIIHHIYAIFTYQFNIYQGLKYEYYVPPPLEQHCIVISYLKTEQKWVCLFHGILQLPCSLIGTKVLPLHLYLFDGLVLQQCYLLVEDVHRFHLELSLGFHLYHIPINYVIRIMYILLKKINMESIMNSHVSRKCNPISNWSYLIKDFEWATISWCQIGNTFQLQGTFPWLYS